MNIQIDSDAIHNALRVVSRLAPPVSGSVTLEAAGDKLWMHSASDLSRARVLLPCEVKGKAFFAVAIDQLGSATKGHKALECSYDKSMFKIKQGSYTAELATVDAIPLEESESEKGTTWKVSAEQAAWLKSAVASVAIKPTAAMVSNMPVVIKITKKAAFVACYDNFHMAFLNDKEVQGDLDLELPLETLQAVLDVVHVGSFKMHVSKSTLTISNTLLKVNLSLPDSEGEVSGEAVIEKAREAIKIDGSEIVMGKEGLVAFLENARGVLGKERSEISVAAEGGKVKLLIQTTNGKAKISLKGNTPKKEVGFRIDYEFFDEAVRKCGDEVVMKIVDDAFVTFKVKNAWVIVSLNQQG